MTEGFVPLVAGALPAGVVPKPTRIRPISPSPAPFEPAEPIQPKTEAPKATPCAPKVTLERQGETITHIRVECGCGQVTELKCEY